MFTLEKLATEVKKVARKRLGASVVKDIKVADYVDADGDKAFEAIIVVDKFDPAVLTTEVMSGISLHLIRAVADEGDERWVFVRFIPEDELAEILANA